MDTQLGFITCLESTAKEQSSQASLTSKTLSQTQYGLPTPTCELFPHALALAKEPKNFREEPVSLGFLLINV